MRKSPNLPTDPEEAWVNSILSRYQKDYLPDRIDELSHRSGCSTDSREIIELVYLIPQDIKDRYMKSAAKMLAAAQ